MTSALRIGLADCGSPEALISVVLKHHADWSPPVEIEDLAREVGIVEFKDLETDAFEGALVADESKNKGVILVRAGMQYERRRFTIGHELGHFLIPTHEGNQQCTVADLRERRFDTVRRRQETEANRFSAGMLMPKPWFLRDMRKLGDADVEHVQKLAKDYKTSLEATVNRYADLTDDVCAFVFAKDGVIRYIRKTTTFPWIVVKRGDPLPPDSASVRAPGGVQSPSAWTELDGSIWVETERGRRTPSILEQSVRQRNGYQITLLFLSPDESRAADGYDDDDEEDDERVADRWAVRFPKR